MSSTARTSRCLRRTRLLTDARRPASRSGTMERLVQAAMRPARRNHAAAFRRTGVGTRWRPYDDAPVRILLVSQMYPSAEAPDFGVFVQGLERELAARGHEIERVVLDRRGGGKLRHAQLGARAVRAARRFRPDVVYAHFLFPTGLSGLLAATRSAGTARRHGARAGRREPDRVSVRPAARPAGREERCGGDRGLGVAAPAARARRSRRPPRRRRSSTAASTSSGSGRSSARPAPRLPFSASAR